MTTATATVGRPRTWQAPRPAPAIKTEVVPYSEAAELAQLENMLRSLADVPYAPLAVPLHEALASSPVRLRARVALAVGRAYHVPANHRLALAAALETLYAASQVHDVLVKRTTLNGSAGALVLMGDHLYAQAAAFAAQAESPAIVALFARTLQRLSEHGVRQQLNASATLVVSTHALLCGAAAEGAARLGNADADDIEALRQAGLAADHPQAGRAALDRVRHPAARRALEALIVPKGS